MRFLSSLILLSRKKSGNLLLYADAGTTTKKPDCRININTVHFSCPQNKTSHRSLLPISGNAGSLHAANSLERSSSEDSGLSGSPHLDGMLMRDVAVTVDKVQGWLCVTS